MPNVAQDRTDGRGTGVDVGVDIKRPHQRRQRRIVHQTNCHRAARRLRSHSDEHVGLVVVRDGKHRIGPVDIRLGQQLRTHPIAVKDNRAFKRVGGAFGAGPVLFDHLGADTGGLLFKTARHGKADIAATDDDNPLLLLRVLTEDFHCSIDISGLRDDVNLIPREELIAGFGCEQRSFAPHPNDNGREGGK